MTMYHSTPEFPTVHAPIPCGKKNDHFNSPSDIDHAPQLFISQLFSQITSNAFQIPETKISTMQVMQFPAVSGEFSGLK